MSELFMLKFCQIITSVLLICVTPRFTAKTPKYTIGSNQKKSTDIGVKNFLLSNCGSVSGKKSCWSLNNQSFTCIPESNICCGDGRSCESNQRCSLTGCITIQNSYNKCPPQPQVPLQIQEFCPVYKFVFTPALSATPNCMYLDNICCGDGTYCPRDTTCQMYPYCCPTGQILCNNNIDNIGGCMPDDGSECCYDGAYCPNNYFCSKGSFCCSKSNPNDCIKMANALETVPSLRTTQLYQSPNIPIKYAPTVSLQPAFTRNPNYQTAAPTTQSNNPNNTVLNINEIIAVTIISIFFFCVLLFICLYYMFLSKDKDTRLRKFEDWITHGSSPQHDMDRAILTNNMETGGYTNNSLYNSTDSVRSDLYSGINSSRHFLSSDKNISPSLSNKITIQPKVNGISPSNHMYKPNITHSTSSFSSSNIPTTGTVAGGTVTGIRPVAYTINDFDDDEEEVDDDIGHQSDQESEIDFRTPQKKH